MVLARITPSVLMTVSSSALALRAVMSTLPPFGFDGAPVERGSVERGLVDDDLDQAVADHVQRDLVARGERNGAHLRHDDAFVRDVRADQRGVAARRGDDGALVDDAAGGALVGEDVAPRQVVRIRHRQRGGDDAAHVHQRARAEQQPAGLLRKILPLALSEP